MSANFLKIGKTFKSQLVKKYLQSSITKIKNLQQLHENIFEKLLYLKILEKDFRPSLAKMLHVLTILIFEISFVCVHARKKCGVSTLESSLSLLLYTWILNSNLPSRRGGVFSKLGIPSPPFACFLPITLLFSTILAY